MPNNPNMDSEGPPLDAEDWDIVFGAYEEYPILAFILAQHLDCVKAYIQNGREGREKAAAGLERAIESLMPHTNYRDAGRTVYQLAVAGNLLPEHEEMIRTIEEQAN